METGRQEKIVLVRKATERTYEAVLHNAMSLDDFDHLRDLYFGIPLCEGLIVHAGEFVVMDRPFQEHLANWVGHIDLSILLD